MVNKEKLSDVIEEAFGCWKTKEGGLAYERKIRKEWDKRTV